MYDASRKAYGAGVSEDKGKEKKKNKKNVAQSKQLWGVLVGVGDKVPNSREASEARCSRRLELRIPSCRGSIWLSCLSLPKDRNHLEGRAWVA